MRFQIADDAFLFVLQIVGDTCFPGKKLRGAVRYLNPGPLEARAPNGNRAFRKGQSPAPAAFYRRHLAVTAAFRSFSLLHGARLSESEISGCFSDCRVAKPPKHRQHLPRTQVLIPPPKRRTLQNLCEDGTFETAENPPGKFNGLVDEDSFWRWAKNVEGKKARQTN